MQRPLLSLLLALAPVSALANTTTEEKIIASLATYDRLEDVLTCMPGYTGAFATPDVLRLKNFSVGVGLPLGNDDFIAHSVIGLQTETPTSLPGEERPYELGCEPAIEQFKKALEGLDKVDLHVTRRLQTRASTSPRVDRKLSGEVISVKRVQHDVHSEFYTFIFAGFEFSLYRSISGPITSK